MSIKRPGDFVMSHHDTMLTDAAFNLDFSQDQFSTWSSDSAGWPGSDPGWSVVTDVGSTPAQQVGTPDLPANDSAAFGQSDLFVDHAADAMGNAGGKPGGGGGGGGGSGLLTSYTSGDPNVDNANEFNI